MRHLHLEFICASFSLGLAILLFGVSSWQLLLLIEGGHGAILPLWFTVAVSLGVAATLLKHAVDGIWAELHQPKRRRHAR